MRYIALFSFWVLALLGPMLGKGGGFSAAGREKSLTEVEAEQIPEPLTAFRLNFGLVWVGERSCAGLAAIELTAEFSYVFESVAILRTEESPPRALLRLPPPCSTYPVYY